MPESCGPDMTAARVPICEGHHHRALCVLRRIGATKAIESNLDDHIVGPKGGFGTILDPQVVRGMQNSGLHGTPITQATVK